ncbi:unnamed protein product [Dimorphilus gyrociliatus]|uniref:Uncharacterized protein n=1 Tax=Dimorphilus gyrociliatus TaxID=2664684 RepID=A0A7I8VAU8_9ANNE|nr:unnamed protein product [Dimorphilus gyrociliatus]
MDVYTHAEVSSCIADYGDYDCKVNMIPYANNFIPHPVMNYNSWHYIRLIINFKEQSRFTHAVLHSRNYHTFMDFRYPGQNDLRVISNTQNNVGRPCFIPVLDREFKNLELGIFSNENNKRPGLVKLIFYRKKHYSGKKMVAQLYIDNLAYISSCVSSDDPSGSNPARNCFKAMDTITKLENKIYNPPENSYQNYYSNWDVSKNSAWYKVQFRHTLILKAVRIKPKNAGSENDATQWLLQVADGSTYDLHVTNANGWNEKVLDSAEFTNTVTLKQPTVRPGASKVGFLEVSFKAYQPTSAALQYETVYSNFTDFTENTATKCTFLATPCEDRLKGEGSSLPPQLVSVPVQYTIN